MTTLSSPRVVRSIRKIKTAFGSDFCGGNQKLF